MAVDRISDVCVVFSGEFSIAGDDKTENVGEGTCDLKDKFEHLERGEVQASSFAWEANAPGGERQRLCRRLPMTRRRTSRSSSPRRAVGAGQGFSWTRAQDLWPLVRPRVEEVLGLIKSHKVEKPAESVMVAEGCFEEACWWLSLCVWPSCFCRWCLGLPSGRCFLFLVSPFFPFCFKRKGGDPGTDQLFHLVCGHCSLAPSRELELFQSPTAATNLRKGLLTVRSRAS